MFFVFWAACSSAQIIEASGSREEAIRKIDNFCKNFSFANAKILKYGSIVEKKSTIFNNTWRGYCEFSNAGNPNPLERRVIQTRLFKKSPWEVIKSIESWGLDTQKIFYPEQNVNFTPINIKFKYILNTEGNKERLSVVDAYAIKEGRYALRRKEPVPHTPPAKGILIYKFFIKPIVKFDTGPVQYDPGLAVGNPTIYKDIHTEVRVRVYVENNLQKEIFSKELISTIFDNLSDQMFADSIKLAPVTQN